MRGRRRFRRHHQTAPRRHLTRNVYDAQRLALYSGRRIPNFRHRKTDFRKNRVAEDVGAMRVEQLLSATAARVGHKTAVVAGRAAHSYAELDRKSDRLAAALTERGIVRGDRLATHLDTGFAAVVTMFGVLKAGATLCPADPATGADALARFLNESGAAGIVTEARLASKAAAALRQAPAVKLVVLVGGVHSETNGNCVGFEDIVGRLEGAAAMPAGGDTDPAIVLMATAGDLDLETFTHADVVSASSVAATREDTVKTAPASIASHYGLWHVVTTVAAGATLILENAAGRAPLFRRADFADVRLALA
jgi:long-chain acyl-CoA synthetase